MGGKRVQNVGSGVQKRGRKTKKKKLAPFFERENGWAKNGTPKKLNVKWTREQCTTLKIHRRDVPASVADVEGVVMTEEGVAAE